MDSAHRLGQGSATRPHPETRPHLVWLPQFHTRCGLHLALGMPGGAALAPAGPPQAARTAGGLLFGRTRHRQAKITHLCRGSLGPSRDPSSPSHSPAPPTATSAPSADLGAPPLPWPYTVATTVGSGTPPPFQNNVSPGGQSHALGLVLCSATAVSAHTPHLGDSRGGSTSPAGRGGALLHKSTPKPVADSGTCLPGALSPMKDSPHTTTMQQPQDHLHRDGGMGEGRGHAAVPQARRLLVQVGRQRQATTRAWFRQALWPGDRSSASAPTDTREDQDRGGALSRPPPAARPGLQAGEDWQVRSTATGPSARWPALGQHSLPSAGSF